MGFVDSIANRLGFQRRLSVVDTAPYALQYPARKTQEVDAEPWLLRTAEGEKWTIPDPEHASNQGNLFARLSWIQIAISSVSAFAASVPFSVMRLEGENKIGISNHPFETLLRKPNPLQSRYEFIVSLLNWYLISGNAYVWLNRQSANDAPSELWLLPPSQVAPVPDGRMFLSGYDYDPLDGGALIRLPASSVLHLRSFNPRSWFVGLSPLEALNLVSHGDLAQQAWNTNLFGKNNAKPAGALAYADPIDNSTWARMQEEVKREHGGVNRSLMMMRNVGAGGVSWLPMAMSQRDMEFLAGRKFTKEEIYALFAPGLASITDTNATEANAKAGQNTFRELAIRPRLTLIAEKITNDVLSVYGDGLVGEFEDVRIRDRAIELAEAQEYARTHTINEIRIKAGDDPLTDERGELFVAQINATSGGIQEAPVSAFGEPPVRGQRETPKESERETDTESDSPEENETEKRAERKAFKRWIKKPGRDVHDFKARYLTHDELHLLAEEADTEQPPFALPNGSITRDAYKQMRLQLDPDDDDAEFVLGRAVENQAADDIEKALRVWLRDVFPNGSESEIDDWERRLLNGQAKFRDVLARALQNGVDLGVNVAMDQAGNIGFGFDYTLVNTQARQWAQDYVGQLITQITDTTRNAVRQQVSAWINNGDSLSALIRDLAPAFGRQRAKLIAATEVTRAYAEAERIAIDSTEGLGGYQWLTARDDRVCPICGPLHGRRINKGETFDGLFPPAHVNCRCWVVGWVES